MSEQNTRPPRSRDSRGRFVREEGRLPADLNRYAAEVPARLRAIADDPETPVKLKLDIERFLFETVYGRNAAREEKPAAGAVQTVRFEGELEAWSR